MLSPGNGLRLALGAAPFGGRPLRFFTLSIVVQGNPSLVLAIEPPVIISKGFRFADIFLDFLFQRAGTVVVHVFIGELVRESYFTNTYTFARVIEKNYLMITEYRLDSWAAS